MLLSNAPSIGVRAASAVYPKYPQLPELFPPDNRASLEWPNQERAQRGGHGDPASHKTAQSPHAAAHRSRAGDDAWDGAGNWPCGMISR